MPGDIVAVKRPELPILQGRMGKHLEKILAVTQPEVGTISSITPLDGIGIEYSDCSGSLVGHHAGVLTLLSDKTDAEARTRDAPVLYASGLIPITAGDRLIFRSGFFSSGIADVIWVTDQRFRADESPPDADPVVARIRRHRFNKEFDIKASDLKKLFLIHSAFYQGPIDEK